MKPVLIIDLEKSWRETEHPRDKFGKFSTVRSGSRVVTSTGKTGVVQETGDSHHKVRYDDGRLAKVKRENILHENDHKKVETQKKKDLAAAKRKASAAAKSKATKEFNKTNALGKTGAAKPIVDPTAEVAPKRKRTAPTKRERDMSAPVYVRDTSHDESSRKQEVKGTIGKNRSREKEDPKANEQNKAASEVKELESSTESKTVDTMWNSPTVQAIMSKPASKRSAEAIRKVAGEITTANDKLARTVVLKMAASRGLNVAGQVNRIGNAATAPRRVKVQETNTYGDLLQAARASMFETLSSVLSGSQNPGKGTAIGAHVITRMKQKLHRDIYSLLNDIPAPHEVRSAIGDAHTAEATLTQKLGRTPTHDEVAEHLQETSKNFRSAPIMQPPVWNADKGDWEAKDQRIKDPSERLRALKNYADQQKTTHLDHGNSDTPDNDRDVTGAMADRTAATPEQRVLEQERQKELQGALPKAMRDMGLSDDEIRVMTVKFSNASATGSKPSLTSSEVAEHLKEHHGMDVTSKWVDNRLMFGMNKVKAARDNNHPALEQLRLFKSIIMNAILKTAYEYDLVKSLNDWGLDTSVLEHTFVRTVYADSRQDLIKSLEPHEYVGGFITLDDGDIVAQITELTVPANNELYKSFGEFANGLKKSMFPHKGSSNSAVNEKAKEYVKANAKKYASLSEQQHSSAKGKTGARTWSEELLLKNQGSAWITWGGKRILVNSATGDVLYDSRNETHREDHNQGAQEDKIDFHHETEAGVDETNAADHDHGIQAFKHDFMAKRRNDWIQKDGKSIVGGAKKEFLDSHDHKALDAYKDLPEKERQKLDAMGSDKAAKRAYLGDHFLNKDGVKDALRKFKEGELSEDEIREHLKGIGSVAGRNAKMMGAFLSDAQKHDVDSEEGHRALAESLGAKEMTRANEEANKNLLPEGKYMIGNPVTGKTMIVHVGGTFTGGRGSRKKDEEGNEEVGKYTSEVMEAFDPDSNTHYEGGERFKWGDLGRTLGYTSKEASDLKATLVGKANTEADKPFMQRISDEEYNKHRAKTKAGLQSSMLHKEFKLVDQFRDKDGKITSQTFAQKMADGTTNHVTVDGEGMVQDPLMQRLLNQRKPATNEAELNELLKNGVGNRTWVTAHFGSDIHTGDALGHHVQLEYDGKGAPRVVGGRYDGYRYIDQRDIPKGTVDPATGEPVKALFKNGKLVDRRFTTQNEVPMKPGNAVLYKDGNGYKKGRIHSVEDGNYKITDGHGHVIGMFKKDGLKAAKQEGRMLSDAGTAVVKVAKTGTHRMTVGETFGSLPPRAQELFEEALRKAKVNSAFDDGGNLHKELELSDAMHKRLNKVLGRSKAGRELMQKFNSAYTNELEVHVPESLRNVISDEGVRVLNDGTAKISAAKFEQLRDIFATGSEGGLSLTHGAQQFMRDHFARKDRKPLLADRANDRKVLQSKYQPSTVASGDPAFDKHYKAQFKGESYLMNPEQGLYGTQLEGVNHLVERGRGIAGHGMGTGKTILGVVSGLHDKAQSLAKGEKPKKTLIVAPKGIMSDWGKEIGSHTNSKGLYIGGGSSFKGSKTIDGKKMWGQDGTEQEAVDIRKFKKGSHADGDHDFHIVSYDTFMRNREHFANSGAYSNIVIDEVHAFKNAKGKRGTALAETTDKFKNVWGLSGTPMENDAREMHSLVDTITGGKHPLGNIREFQNNYMKKDKNGKLVGVKPDKAEELGDILANIVQFRGGDDVTYNDGSRIKFPHLIGKESSEGNPNPHVDFIGNMADRNRDHKTTDYYGTKHSITDFDTDTKTVANAKNGESYDVSTTVPKNVNPETAAMLAKYKELEAKYLPESKLNELASAAATGIDQGQKGSQNYLTAMQKLQKYLNAPLAHKMYVGSGNALDSDATDAQAVSKGASKGKAGLVEGEHYALDADGFKRYYESDGKGGYNKNPDGSPRLLPPLHKNNPKAQYLQDRIHTYLDSLQHENKQRVTRGEKPLVPKLVVKSSYTTFGTDIVDNVLKEVRASHPIFRDLAKQGHGELKQGRFTGDADDREATKVGFRGNKNAYMANQGNLWATTVSPAGKEGVDFGNAHVMFHFDQDWNPQKMAQFTARVRRSDSAKTHAQSGRANAVRVESLHVPNTVEDFMFNAQDAKMESIQHVVTNTRTAERNPKLGETEGTAGHGHRGFTSRKQPRRPKQPEVRPERLSTDKPERRLPKRETKVADKAIQLVIIL